MQTNTKLLRSYRREYTIVAKLLTSRCLITIGAGPPMVQLEFIAKTILRTVYSRMFLIVLMDTININRLIKLITKRKLTMKNDNKNLFFKQTDDALFKSQGHG